MIWGPVPSSRLQCYLRGPGARRAVCRAGGGRGGRLWRSHRDPALLLHHRGQPQPQEQVLSLSRRCPASSPCLPTAVPYQTIRTCTPAWPTTETGFWTPWPHEIPWYTLNRHVGLVYQHVSSYCWYMVWGCSYITSALFGVSDRGLKVLIFS